ncbi:isopenicillin N synthase family oxygenase [Streptomyces kunmingensis]|uniref:Isopenicillin N synthase family oxygenase n=1 Tax=Streptomyces kunmingensis TaxID=68225 RepID=A0ABU6C968_9ACTN|nr:2-oxoglutarate and iron-dependent oxygenase domain-containing protein [Streptomyces kunmingensis]MEB3960900.1 isopenicillin N synthase family oxygenase [Streptomyces kunmingensis]
MSGAIPTVDLSTWPTASAEERRATATALDQALRETGMFLLKGHGVPREAMDELRAQGREFFALPHETKAPYAIGAPYESGWLEMHPGGGVGVTLEEGAEPAAAPDLHESFYAGPAYRSGDETTDRYCYPPNRWPDPVLPGLRRATEAYTDHMQRVALGLNALFAEVLGLPRDFFNSRAQRATWTQNVSWYPSLASVGTVASGQLRNGPHTDLGAFTILSRQQGVGGLQAWNEADGWFAPPYDPEALVVNLGDLMELWTNGRWRALRHRVLAPSPSAPHEELLSLVFFFESDPDTLIEPLAPPAGGDAGFAPVLSRRSVLEKLGVHPLPIPLP